MNGTIITIRPYSTGMHVAPVDGPPTLPVLKAAIGGGYIEAVPGFDTIERDGMICQCVAFCDENGKLEGMPVNAYATILWDVALRRAGGPGLLLPDGKTPADMLVGQVAVVFGDQEFMEAL